MVASCSRPRYAVKLVTSGRWWERKGRLWHKFPTSLAAWALPPRGYAYFQPHLASLRFLSAWPRPPLGVERYPDGKHIHIRCDKDTRDFSRLQMYSRILALGVLVRVLVNVATVAVQVHVELLGSKLHYGTIGKHDGDAYHRLSLLCLTTPRILPLYGPLRAPWMPSSASKEPKGPPNPLRLRRCARGRSSAGEENRRAPLSLSSHRPKSSGVGSGAESSTIGRRAEVLASGTLSGGSSYATFMSALPSSERCFPC